MTPRSVSRGREFPVATLVIVGLIAVLALAATWVWEGKQAEKQAAAGPQHPDEIDPFAGGYPVPPHARPEAARAVAVDQRRSGAAAPVTDKEATRG